MKLYFKSQGIYCQDMCKLKDVAIGSIACRQCENNIYMNTRENWVDCAADENPTDMKINSKVNLFPLGKY
jgi:hypothetical protein